MNLPIINTLLISTLYVVFIFMLYRFPNSINKNNIKTPTTKSIVKQIQTTTQQQSTTQHQTKQKTKHVRFNDELMVETDNTEQYAGCTGEFNGNHKMYIRDGNEYKLLNNVINKHRNNRIHSIRGSYKNRQNYPVDIDMVNVVIN